MSAEKPDAVVDLVVVLTAKDVSSLPELRELMATQVALSREEPGCLRFEAFESQTVPGTIIVVERWTTQAALDQHRQAKAITTVYMPKILPLVERVLHVCSALPHFRTLRTN
ncbi:MAG: antibiotic biosynthesis monooxygenase [Betaproteobacteria bacterium]|nr:antibiotic biosynthesis monooxygenase [Betaproteobacteria bacterium]